MQLKFLNTHTHVPSGIINIQVARVIVLNERNPKLQKTKQIRRVRIDLCKCEVLLHLNWWKLPLERRIPPSILAARNLQWRITHCATNGFASFLQRWIPLIEGYNSAAFIVYHIAILGCVLEDFNCMLLGGWTLNGIRTVVPQERIPKPGGHIRYLRTVYHIDSRCLPKAHLFRYSNALPHGEQPSNCPC